MGNEETLLPWMYLKVLRIPKEEVASSPFLSGPLCRCVHIPAFPLQPFHCSAWPPLTLYPGLSFDCRLGMEEHPYSSRLKKIRVLLEQTSVTREEVVSELGEFPPPITFRLHVAAWSQACPSVLRCHGYALQDPVGGITTFSLLQPRDCLGLQCDGRYWELMFIDTAL